MRSLFIPLLGVLAALPAPAQDPSEPESRPATPTEQVKAIEKEHDAARQAFFKAYSAAKNQEEKEALFKEKYPKAETWFERLYVIAKADAKGEGAERALVWIVTHDDSGKKSTEALATLERDHIEGRGLDALADALGQMTSVKSEAFLKALEEKSPHREVKGRALYARAEQMQNLARNAAFVKKADTPEKQKEIEEYFSKEDLERLRTVDPSANDKEIEAIFERVKEKYADVPAAYGGTLGERAEGDLFEIRSLAIGKIVPEIVGESIQGQPLKLSDFKGKVVVLDFWGNW